MGERTHSNICCGSSTKALLTIVTVTSREGEQGPGSSLRVIATAAVPAHDCVPEPACGLHAGRFGSCMRRPLRARVAELKDARRTRRRAVPRRGARPDRPGGSTPRLPSETRDARIPRKGDVNPALARTAAVLPFRSFDGRLARRPQPGSGRATSPPQPCAGSRGSDANARYIAEGERFVDNPSAKLGL